MALPSTKMLLCYLQLSSSWENAEEALSVSNLFKIVRQGFMSVVETAGVSESRPKCILIVHREHRLCELVLHMVHHLPSMKAKLAFAS